MQIKQTLKSFFLAAWALPKWYTIPAAIFVTGGVIYVAAFVLEKPVQFSYAGPTCVNRLMLLPNIHTSSNTSNYDAHPVNLISIGSWPVAARSVCVTPMRAPQPGISRVSLAPYGGLFARQTFAVQVAQPVVADVKAFAKPIPVSKPLALKLSGGDMIFSYALEVADKQVKCAAKDMTLSCDVEKLSLAQSQSYPVRLLRQFKGQEVSTVISKDIRTLSATTLTDSSIKTDEIVYSKPTDISVVADKKLMKIDVDLYKIDGSTRSKLESSATITDTGFTVTLPNELPRSATYQLVTSKVEATDGSGLVQPHVLAFKTSGGPKVTGVNVGSTGVPMNSKVIIAFDQPLAEKQDITKFVSLSGGASLIGKQGNQIVVSVAGVPKCGDFTVKLTNDLQSQYDIGGHSSFNYTGRTICHTIGTIGTSVQGRAINAYYFGNGATSVLYTGTIHGSEASTKSLMDRWIQDLEAKARNIPAHVTVVVVPMINPDGYARGGRVNANNVDLNRNFATSDWQKDITTVNNQPFPGGGGASAMSEPETQAIAGLAQRLRPKVIVSYHSIGGMVAGNQSGNSASLAATYAQASGYRNITGQSGDNFEYAISGTADDWYAKIGIPSLLVELGSHSYHQFERNQSAMWSLINS